MAISNSIVDYLNSAGQDSSYKARKRLAQQQGISNYTGSAKQNTSLLNSLRNAAASSTGSRPSKNVLAGVGDTPATALNLTGATKSPTVNAASPSGFGIGDTPATALNLTGATQAPTINADASTASAATSAYGMASTTSYPTNYKESEKTSTAYRNYQNKLANLPDDYEESDYVKDRRDKLTEVENARPADFTSKYQAQIDDLLNRIYGDKGFSYTAEDLQNDDLYKMYAQQYQQSASRAMRDTMGQAQAASGGYGSTYAQQVGQQAYDQTMSGLNDKVLDFRDRAYQTYLNNQSNRYNQLNAFQTQDNTDYGRYRDTVADWQADRNYYLGALQGEQANDLNIYGVNNQNYYKALDALQGNYQTENANDQWLAQYEMNKQAQDYENMLTQQKIEQGGYDTLLAKLQYEDYLKKRKAAASGSRSGRSRNSGSGSSSASATRPNITKASKGKVSNWDVLNAMNQLKKIDNGSALVKTTKQDFLDYVTKNYEIEHLPETISDKVFNSKKSILNGR